MQIRFLQTNSDEIRVWTRRSFFPALWFLWQLPSSSAPALVSSNQPPVSTRKQATVTRLSGFGAVPLHDQRVLPPVDPFLSEQKVGVNSPSNLKTFPKDTPYWKLPYSRVTIPLDPLKQNFGRWSSSSESNRRERGEQFLGPISGPRPLTNPARLTRFLRNGEFERWEAIRLLGPEKGRLKARYGVRGKTQQTLAKARFGQATLRRGWSRRFLAHSLLSDRPYRRVRARDLVLGRRPRPARASRLRPLRRTDRLSERVRRERGSMQGVRKTRVRKGQQTLLRLPQQQTWSRFVLPQNPVLAQERRQWWREWHQNDARFLYETRRAGSLQRDRVGRRNGGWWRFLRSSHLDLPNTPFDSSLTTPEIRGRFVRRPFDSSLIAQRPIARRGQSEMDWAYPTHFQPARDQRTVALGWATRMKKPEHLEKAVSQTPTGRLDYANSYWRILSPLTRSSLWLLPGSFSIVWTASLLLRQSFLSVQKDFVRALDQLVRRGGRRELDPEWMEWLLETLGISQQNAGIRHYAAGNRSLARTLAGLRRESSMLLEVVWYLRTQRRTPRSFPRWMRKPKQVVRGPRPTLLVGAPGTGKTRLVRVLADEAGVPVIYQCLAAFTDAGSNFTAFGFGRTVAPRAVQRGFAEARERVPAILFLDELDALGANRGGVLLDSQNPTSSPRSGDQVLGLGQLLVELDSRGKNQGLVVFGATNRPAALDPALLRPGRFDRHLAISLPNRKKRRAILQLYARQRTLNSHDWNWNRILADTQGVSAAHLARITNWTAISRVLTPKTTPTSDLLEKSLERLLRVQKESSQAPNPRDPFFQMRRVYAKARCSLVHARLRPTRPQIPLSTHKATSLPFSLFSPTTYRTKAEKQRVLCSLFATRGREWMLLQSITGNGRRYWQQRNLPTLGWWITTWLKDIENLASEPQTLFLRSFLTKEFRHDRPLLRYSLQTAGKETKAVRTPINTGEFSNQFSTVIEEIKQQEEWPSQWYSFEIPEVSGFRSVHWLPPELHVKKSFSTQTGPRHQQTRLLGLKIYKQASVILNHNRSELDLLVSLLLQRNELSSEEILKVVTSLLGIVLPLGLGSRLRSS